MALIVQKYGGSSLASPELVKRIAQKVVDRYQNGDKLIIVVSAMGKTTNELIAKANEISDNPTKREMDMLLSVGERVSIAMMSMAINDLVPDLAVSFTGSQIGLITDCNHSDARILEIKGDRLREALANGKVAVIAGFQGVSLNKEITTLGRGGSDTTAVAVAAALSADLCEIYSDVDGVYTADPRICPEAKRLDEVDFDTMLEMSTLGAKVLKDDAVEYAKRLNIKIACGSSFDGRIGTIVSDHSLANIEIASLVYYDKLCYINNEKSVELIAKLPDVRFFQQVGEKGFLVYDQKYQTQLPASELCVSLAMVGTGIKNQMADIQKVMNYLKAEKAEILAINCSNLRYEIFFKTALSKEQMQTIHEIIFAKM